MRQPMVVLVVTDLHSQKKIIPPLAATVASLKPDAIFCLGDLTIYGPSAGPYTEAFLDAVGVGSRPIFCVSGNNDDPVSLEFLRAHNSLLDYQIRKLGEDRIVGIGYMPPEQVFNPDLDEAILLSHIPPKKDSVPESVTKVPRFHFAGHLHKYERIWMLGKTTIVQVPTAMDLRAVRFTLPEGTVEFIGLGEQKLQK